jgi:hypothetical protein
MEFEFISKNCDTFTKIKFEFNTDLAEEVVEQFINFMRANGFSTDDIVDKDE